MKYLIILNLLLITLSSCSYSKSKSVSKNFSLGLETFGKNLSCDKVDIYADDAVLSGNEVYYGQVLKFRFENLKGLKNVNGKIFPGLKMYVLNSKKDTMIVYEDLYEEYNGGLALDPFTALAEITVGNPIFSNADYTAHILIWDKKSKGNTFSSKFKFKPLPNKFNKITEKGVSAKEVYLFSKRTNEVLLKNEIKIMEQVYIYFNGVEGFTEVDNTIFAGASLKAIDGNNKVLMDKSDLFEEYSESGIDAESFIELFSLSFYVIEKNVKNPITVQSKIWDKKSNSYLEFETQCTIVKE
jgi:hypothetical protein